MDARICSKNLVLLFLFLKLEICANINLIFRYSKYYVIREIVILKGLSIKFLSGPLTSSASNETD